MYLAAHMSEQSVERWLNAGSVDHLFKGPQEKALFKYVSGYITKHGKLPAVKTCREDTKLPIPKSVAEPSGKYHERIRERHIRTSLSAASTRVQEHLDRGVGHADDALAVMRDAVAGLIMQDSASGVVDLRDAADVLWPEYKAHWEAEDGEMGMQFGYPYLDKYGPLAGGEVGSIVGRPAAGKTFMLLNMARHFWGVQGKVPLFITPEMKPNKILLRLASMEFGLPIKRLAKGELLPKVAKQYKAALEALKSCPVPFHVVDGKVTPTVPDIIAYARQLGVDGVYIDGAYLLKHATERNRFLRVAENMDLIKNDLATGLNLPVMASWQFSRKAEEKVKKKKQDEVDLEDIGYSDAIGQHSSVVLGMFQEEGVETLVRRLVTVMKGRDGMTGEFHVRWMFEGPGAMDFSEDKEEDVTAIEFIDGS